MCGRYVIKDAKERFAEFFDIDSVMCAAIIRFNIAPTTGVPVVRFQDGRRTMSEMRWGLIPAWAKSDAKLPMMVNARAETVASKPSFRSAFKYRRCIVPASGYFEWQKVEGGLKQPYYFERQDGHPIAFAGIWEGETVATITTEPNAEAAPIHDRMPVILEKENWERFLAAEPLTEEERGVLLAPSPPGTLKLWPVSRLVGSVKNQGAELIEPIPQDLPLPTRPIL